MTTTGSMALLPRSCFIDLPFVCLIIALWKKKKKKIRPKEIPFVASKLWNYFHLLGFLPPPSQKYVVFNDVLGLFPLLVCSVNCAGIALRARAIHRLNGTAFCLPSLHLKVTDMANFNTKLYEGKRLSFLSPVH